MSISTSSRGGNALSNDVADSDYNASVPESIVISTMRHLMGVVQQLAAPENQTKLANDLIDDKQCRSILKLFSDLLKLNKVTTGIDTISQQDRLSYLKDFL